MLKLMKEDFLLFMRRFNHTVPAAAVNTKTKEDLVICRRRTTVLTNANFVQRQRDAKDEAVGKKDHDITKRDYEKRRSSIEESRGYSNRSGEERCCCCDESN